MDVIAKAPEAAEASGAKNENDGSDDDEEEACSSSQFSWGHCPHGEYDAEKSITCSHGVPPALEKLLLGLSKKNICRLASNRYDELRMIRFSLFWCGLEQSSPWMISSSWLIALLFAVVVPIAYLCLVDCSDCDTSHQHPFDAAVQVSEAALAAVSFFCLSRNMRKYGLRGFLFLDQMTNESIEVQTGYKEELNKAFRILQFVILPSFLVELVYQVWWFTYATVHISFIRISAARNAIMCIAVMISWLYKNAVFLLACILFRLMCYLQILRFDGYIKMLESVPEVLVILREYLHLRQQLNIISHRYRLFIVLSLVTVTASQFIFLLLVTSTTGVVNFFRAGNLAICSVVQLIGFALCLHGAARITHKAQRIISIVSQWHAMSTCQTYASVGPDIEDGLIEWVNFEQLNGDADADLNCALNMYSILQEKQKNEVAAIHMRQAFVSHLQNDQAGITLYGYMLDRSFVYALVSVELSLLLFILGLTVGIK